MKYTPGLIFNSTVDPDATEVIVSADIPGYYYVTSCFHDCTMPFHASTLEDYINRGAAIIVTDIFVGAT